MTELNLANNLGTYRHTDRGSLRNHAPTHGARGNDGGVAASRCRAARTTAPTAVFSERAYAVDMSRAQSLQLEIMTAEGDRVTLSLAGSRSVQLAGYQASDASTAVAATGVTVAASGNFSYAVEGELSAEESAAIQDLLARVDELAGRFFSGDLDGLLRQVNDVDLDMEQLASFSLQMDMTRAVEVSSAYRSVQAMTADGAETAGASPATSADLFAFIDDLNAARAADAGRKDLFDDLFKSAVQMLQSARRVEPAIEDPAPDTATALLGRLLSALDAATADAAGAPDVQDAAESTAAA